MKRVVLHIDRLVLHGVDRADAAALAAAMQDELDVLLSRSETLARLTARHGRDAVHAGDARVPQQSSAAMLGRAVARRIAFPDKRP